MTSMNPSMISRTTWNELTNLPFHHRDPFDRMLVAQATVDDMQLLSRDNRLSAYEIKRIW